MAAGLHASIKLRWYDDSNLLTDDCRQLLVNFLDSIGVTSDVACDLLEVMLMSRAKDIALTTSEMRQGIIRLRQNRKEKDVEGGLTDRNIQVWIKYFEQIGFFETISGKHRFASNKKPREAFKRTRQVVEESLKYTDKLLEKLEKAYRII